MPSKRSSRSPSGSRVLRCSRPAVVRARFSRMWNSHVLNDDRPSKRSTPRTTASQVSWTTSSATERFATTVPASLSNLVWYMATRLAKAASSPSRRRTTRSPSSLTATNATGVSTSATAFTMFGPPAPCRVTARQVRRTANPPLVSTGVALAVTRVHAARPFPETPVNPQPRSASLSGACFTRRKGVVAHGVLRRAGAAADRQRRMRDEGGRADPTSGSAPVSHGECWRSASGRVSTCLTTPRP